MLCKLLALKADDRNVQPEQIIYEIYQTAARMKDRLTNGQLLLIDQWINFYKKVSQEQLEEIKEEIEMSFVATTITEYIQHEAKEEGKIEGSIKTLEILFHEGILSQQEFEKRVAPLRKELQTLLLPKQNIAPTTKKGKAHKQPSPKATP